MGIALLTQRRAGHRSSLCRMHALPDREVQSKISWRKGCSNIEFFPRDIAARGAPTETPFLAALSMPVLYYWQSKRFRATVGAVRLDEDARAVLAKIEMHLPEVPYLEGLRAMTDALQAARSYSATAWLLGESSCAISVSFWLSASKRPANGRDRLVALCYCGRSRLLRS